MVREITEQRKKEMEQLKSQKLESAQTAKDGEHHALKAFEASGLDLSKINTYRQERIAESEKRYKATEAKMIQDAKEKTEVDSPVDIQRSLLLPEGVLSLSPSWVAAFSSHDEKDTLTAASVVKAQDMLTGGGCKDYSNWASGGGWGCLGSGVGEVQSWVDFGFWFRPTVNRFYSVMPHFKLRGFSIVQANDGFWDCKNASVKLSCWTNAWQYNNWKGWSNVDVYSKGGDNINTNERVDIDRYPYSSYLFGGTDWAFIKCTIGLHARAQGGGSHAKNDFATGGANYLCVPECNVW